VRPGGIPAVPAQFGPVRLARLQPRPSANLGPCDCDSAPNGTIKALIALKPPKRRIVEAIGLKGWAWWS